MHASFSLSSSDPFSSSLFCSYASELRIPCSSSRAYVRACASSHNFRLLGSELPLLWPSLEKSQWKELYERVRTCPNVSDRVPRSDNLGLLIWLVSFGSLIWPRNMPYSASCTSIWFHIPSTLWISIGSAVMQVLSVVRLDRIVTVGKKKVSVNIFCDFIWFLWHGSHPCRTSRNYSFNFSLQHP